MEMTKVEELFNYFSDNISFTESIESKKTYHENRLINALLLMQSLCERKVNISARRDEIYFNLDPCFWEKVTEEQLKELYVCGVVYDADHEILYMFA